MEIGYRFHQSKWRHGMLQLLLFALGMKLLQSVVIQPFLDFVFRLGLETTGYRILFNNNILEFFLTPIGIGVGIIMILFVTGTSFFEFSVVILFVKALLQNDRVSIIDTIKNFSMAKKRIKPVEIILYFIYVFLFLPIAGLGYSSPLFPYFKIPNFITGEIAKNEFGPLLIFLIYGSIALIFFLTVYTIPILITEELSFFASLKKSIIRVFSRFSLFLKLLLVYLPVWGLLDWLPKYLLNSVVSPVLLNEYLTFSGRALTGEGLLFFLVFLFNLIGQLIVPPLLLVIIAENYFTGIEQEMIAPEKRYTFVKAKTFIGKLAQIRLPKKIIKRVMIPLLVLAALFQVFIQWNSETAGDLYKPFVVGHRGSLKGVENTLEAIQGAIDGGAKYAEIDILLSKDGVPMVIHDDSLQRLAGENTMVHELTAAELKEIRLQQNGLSGRISTLAEVLQYTAGKIELAVELKTHGYEKKNLVDEVAKLMEEYQVLESAVFLSLEYSLVDEMNTKFPKTTSGYCIFGGLGYFSPATIKTMNIDFVFLEEWVATRENLLEFRRAWLPVFVWTVNEAENMERFLELGVSGLVTDYPDLAEEELTNYQSGHPRPYLEENE